MNIRHLCLVVLPGLLAACDPLPCDGDSAVAVATRELGQERLRKLAHDIDALWLARPNSAQPVVYRSRDNMPPEFEELDVRMLRVHNDRAILRLRGCFDHHLDLAVARDESGVWYIALQYGQGPWAGRETLWTRETQ